MVLSSDESILESMIVPDKICKDMHHKSYFLLELRRIENLEFHVRLSEGVDQPIDPLAKEGVFPKGNMENIPKTRPINISSKPSILENLYIGENSSPEEISIYKSLFKEFCDVFAW